MIAAESWGCPPWVIAEDDDKITWYIRWLRYRQAKAQAEELRK